MSKNRHQLGLHTKDERKQAYGLAKRVYDESMKNKLYLYGLGYIEAILDLARHEAPDDSDFISALKYMYEDLTVRFEDQRAG